MFENVPSFNGSVSSSNKEQTSPKQIYIFDQLTLFSFETSRFVKTPVLCYNTALINAMLLCL